MSDIHIHREHRLGWDAAVRLAQDWQAQAEQDWGLVCKALAQDGAQHIAFERPGLKGSLRVTDREFELRMSLGFLLEAYRARIEAAMQQRLEGWLGGT
ncbi:MAG: polyhydroxyalkanoic acid system family protein [Curvibacter sp.]|nr:polyhydroxyalkanoic acid system family protein [Curvibacter sp.]